MATNESLIASALQQRREYDVLGVVRPMVEFVPASAVQEQFRFLISSIQDWSDRGLDPLTVESSLWYLGRPLGITVRSSHSVGAEHSIEEWVAFPIMISELPLDVVVCCTVTNGPGGEVVGGVSWYPFNSRGELKTGSRRYRLHRGVRADGSERKPVTTGDVPYEDWENLARDKKLGRIVDVPWLDQLATNNVRKRTDAKRLERLTGNPIQEVPLIHIELPSTSSALPVCFMSCSEYHGGEAWGRYLSAPVNPFETVYDLEIGYENLSEHKAAVLAKSMSLTASVDAQPGIRELRQLKLILARPLLQALATKADDAALIWQFRSFLAKDPQGFLPFMRCVDWESPAERSEAERLIPTWKQITFEDALVCLSFQFRGILAVRKYAIECVLAKESTSKLHLFLLQLTQGVRYDVERELELFLIGQCVQHWNICSHTYWFFTVEVELEASNASLGKVYTEARKNLLSALEKVPVFAANIRHQAQLKQMLSTLFRTVHGDPRDRTAKMALAKQLIQSQDCGIKELFPSQVTNSAAAAAAAAGPSTALVADSAAPPPHPPFGVEGSSPSLPSHPEVPLDGVTDADLYLFKSAKMPLKINFLKQKSQSTSNSSSSSSDTAQRHFPVIFKSGDDVRQDQLVIQMIAVMDQMLKANGLDLCLTPYRVLATSSNDGFVELVPDVVTFQSVQRDVVGHIRSNNTTSDALSKAMDKFVRSCAGYCVITFLLGIGDRHLENLLITKDGRLLHIDFGFMFGNDPKPFPPPMKINKEMVDAMGGVQSDQYGNFQIHCVSAYNILRNHSSVLLSALLLMIDASIDQISHGSNNTNPKYAGVDPRLHILKVQDKLRLELTNAEAKQYILNVIADSVGAIFTNLWDVIHVAAQAVRN